MQGSPTPVRNQAAQQEVSSGRASEASSAAAHRSPLLALPSELYPALPPSAPCQWKNCLSRNWSLVPKRLGTAALVNHRISELKGMLKCDLVRTPQPKDEKLNFERGYVTGSDPFSGLYFLSGCVCLFFAIYIPLKF